MAASKTNVVKTGTFREWITSDSSGKYPAESGRYHLYVSYTCPFAHRALIMRKLKGLEDCISVDVVALKKDEKGWKFDPEVKGTTRDTVNGCEYLSEVYFMADKDYEGRYSVPVLWDKKTKTIVNNESAEIMRMLNAEFNHLCPTEVQKTLDFYPEGLRKDIDEINDWVSKDVNTGVYRAGFATSQDVYDKAVREVFGALERVEEIVSHQRYLSGSTITEADIRLFTSLIRFDRIYYGLFKCNKKRIIDYPNLWEYLKDLYQRNAFSGTTNMYLMDYGYQAGMLNLNPHGIVAIGPDIDYFETHNRQEKFPQ